MRCRRHDYRYAFLLQSQRSSGDGWELEKINMIVAKTHWNPSADVYETDEKINIILELAGVDPEKIDIALYEDAIVVEGKRILPPCSPNGIYHMAEIRQGSF